MSTKYFLATNLPIPYPLAVEDRERADMLAHCAQDVELQRRTEFETMRAGVFNDVFLFCKPHMDDIGSPEYATATYAARVAFAYGEPTQKQAADAGLKDFVVQARKFFETRSEYLKTWRTNLATRWAYHEASLKKTHMLRLRAEVPTKLKCPPLYQT